VLGVISRLDNDTLVCGTSDQSSSVQNFASFNGNGPYTSTLNFKTSYLSPTANPAPGPFTASVTLQVQYP
jgi:type 1 fimbria pilin